MSTSSPHAPHHTNPFEGFDESVERAVGADMRLIYGMAAPILMVLGLIVILALSPAVWLVAAIVVLEAGCTAVVVTGILGMIGGDSYDEQDAD